MGRTILIKKRKKINLNKKNKYTLACVGLS